MPTKIVDGYFVHACQYCGHEQKELTSKPSPFMFSQYRCTGCQRPLDDLNTDLPDSDPKKCRPGLNGTA